MKRGAMRKYDTYDFEITNPFDRGNLIGGFAYIEFEDPQRNILVIMSKADIEKRKNVAKSKDFWNKWYDEMALKTVVNAACGKVTLDPEKIDPDFRIMQQSESDAAEAELAEELRQNANRETINVTPMEPEPEPSAIPERTQPVQAKVEMPTRTQTEPAPQFVGVDTGRDIPEDFKVEF